MKTKKERSLKDVWKKIMKKKDDSRRTSRWEPSHKQFIGL